MLILTIFIRTVLLFYSNCRVALLLIMFFTHLHIDFKKMYICVFLSRNGHHDAYNVGPPLGGDIAVIGAPHDGLMPQPGSVLVDTGIILCIYYLHTKTSCFTSIM